MRHFADRLIEQIEKTGNYGCLGIDPRPDWTPDGEHATFELELSLLAARGGLPAIKPQAAFLGDNRDRVKTLTKIARRDDSSMLNVVDVKRGDIGTTAEAYAEEWLADDSVDAITVNPYLGADSLEPFVKVAAANGKGLFVLVRTSNPGANDIQDRRIAGHVDAVDLELMREKIERFADGSGLEWSDVETVFDVVKKIMSWEEVQHEERGTTIAQQDNADMTVCEAVARMVDKIGRDHLGERGYSLVGAVVGATVPAPLVARLRELMPRAIFLMPGLGAQGGGMDSIRTALDKNGLGVLAPSSRSLNYPWKKKDGTGSRPDDWREAIRKAIADFKTTVQVVKA